MDLTTFYALLTPAGQSLLAEVEERRPDEKTLLAALTELRKRYPTDLASAAVETAMLRARAAAAPSRSDGRVRARGVHGRPVRPTLPARGLSGRSRGRCGRSRCNTEV